MPKLSIRELDLKSKRVFIRVDFNVPLTAEGNVAEDTRIRASLESIRYASSQGARVILASHLGRPKGKPNPQMSLRSVATRLGELLGASGSQPVHGEPVQGEPDMHIGPKADTPIPVAFAEECIGAAAQGAVSALRPGQVLLLENLRFHKEEEANDATFSQALASLCDLYVNDAFGSAHRAHASTEGMTKFVPKAAAGFLMEKELTYLGKAISHPDRPYVAILGGAKVSDKIEVVQNLMKLTDAMLIGGGMAYTFLKARGIPVGRSLVEDDKLDLARRVLDDAAKRHFPFKLPIDHVVAENPDAAPSGMVPVEKTPADRMGLDIGRETINDYCARILSAKTIVWNGPMGVFEKPQFARGTMAVAEAVAKSGATSIIGGGDSIAAVQMAGVAGRITHISTGGGASLEFLAGYKLPGVEALTNK